MLRLSPSEIQGLLHDAEASKSGRVMYPVRTFDGDLLDAIAHDLQDFYELSTRLEAAVQDALQNGDEELVNLLTWIYSGGFDHDHIA